MKFKIGDIVRQNWFHRPGTYDNALFEIITTIDQHKQNCNFVRVAPLNELAKRFLEETQLNHLPLEDIGGPKGSMGINEVFFYFANGFERAVYDPKMSQLK